MKQKRFVFFLQQWNASDFMSSELTATLSPIQEESIRQMIDIDGRTWNSVAKIYDISVPQVREAHRRARMAAESRIGSMSELWRESVVYMCLDVASQAQECFTKSRKKKIKKVKKSTPQGDHFETHVESSNGDPRFLNTRLEAAKTIASIQVPKEVNLNQKVEHDFSIMLDMSDENLEQMASLARLKQQGVLAIDQKDYRVVDAVEESAGSQDALQSVVPSFDSGSGEESCDLRRDGVGRNEIPSEEG